MVLLAESLVKTSKPLKPIGQPCAGLSGAMIAPVNHPDVSRIVACLHVSASPLTAARAVRKKLKGWRKLPASHRRYAIAAAIQAHAKNIHLYRYVNGSVPRKFPKFKPRYFFNSETKGTVIV